MGILSGMNLGRRARLIIALALLTNAAVLLAGGLVFGTYEQFRRDFSEEDIPMAGQVTQSSHQLNQLQLELVQLLEQARSRSQPAAALAQRAKTLADQLDTTQQLVADLKSRSAREVWLNVDELSRRTQAYRQSVLAATELLPHDLAQATQRVRQAEHRLHQVHEEAFALVDKINQHMVEEARALQQFVFRLVLPLGLLLSLAMGLVFWWMRRLSLDLAGTFDSIRSSLRRLRKGKLSDPVQLAASTQEASDMALSLETLRQSMEELDRLRFGLEWQVQERTQQLQDVNKELALHVQRLLTTEKQLQLYKKIYDSTSDAIVITDLRGRIIDINPAYEQMTGYDRTELLGRSSRTIRPPSDDAALLPSMWRDLAEQGRWSGELEERRRDDVVVPVLQTINTIYDDQHCPSFYLAVLRDISALKAAEKQLAQLAYFDRLTGLPNRRLLMDRLDHALKLAARSKSYGALLFLDLDRFKHVNDSHGHQMGDELLAEASRRIRGCVRSSDTVGRLAGDEFVVLMEDLSSDAAQAGAVGRQIGQHIVKALGANYTLGGVVVHCSASVGMALFGNELAVDVEELLSKADTAMYEAKKSGRAALATFEPAMWDTLRLRMELESRLRQALREERFFLLFQPLVDVSRRVVGCEALLRWDDAVRGMIPPNDFIRLAEETRLIEEIGQRVLAMVCRQLKLWEVRPGLQDLSIAMNVSSPHFEREDFVDQVKQSIARHGINPARLKLELTESVIVKDVASSVAKIKELQALGLRLAMDDFGTGYSSLAYLRDLPFNQIKIDRSFIHRMETERSDRFIVQAVLAMARFLNLEVVAEGVETESQRLQLIDLGCQLFQGYLFSQPVAAQALEELLAAQDQDPLSAAISAS